CERRFTGKFNLKSHMISHSQDKPHQCTECGNQFRRKHDLQRHVRTLHSLDRPHKCPNCHMAFARTDALQRH
ncbi:hypothetical protein CXG81DRAFT_5995, partial [Caulochytrium protostelioides]